VVVKKHIVYATYKTEAGDNFSSTTPPVGLPVIESSNFNVVADDVFIGKNTYRLDATTKLSWDITG